MDTISMEDALLATKQALLGVVTPELRAVVVDICTKKNLFYIRVYYDGEASEQLIDSWQLMMTEASASLGADSFLDNGEERLDYPQEIPLKGQFAYHRREAPTDSTNNLRLLGRELVDFKKDIGFFVSPLDGTKIASEWGIIHQSTEGDVVIPAKPESYLIGPYPVMYAMLSLQRALVKIVTPELKLVIADVSEEKNILFIRFYYDGLVCKEILGDWELAITKTLADFGPSYQLDGKIERVDHLQIPPSRGRYAYLRKNPRLLSPMRYSILEYPDPQKLIYDFAGRGIRGIPGFRYVYKTPLLKPMSIETKALLATQKALLSIATIELRAIVIDVRTEEKIFYIRIYYNKEASKAVLNQWEHLMIKVHEESTLNYRLDGKIEKLNYPFPIPFEGRVAYLRMEKPIVSGVTIPWPKSKFSRFLSWIASFSKTRSKKDVIVKRELVDFKQKIGVFVSPIDTEQVSTRWGVINYSADGTHIIPGKSESYEIPIPVIDYVLLVLQRALLGVITPELLAVIVDTQEEDGSLKVRFYHDQPVNAQILDKWEIALSETWADLGADYEFDGQIKQLISAQDKLLQGKVVYRRYSKPFNFPIDERQSDAR